MKSPNKKKILHIQLLPLLSGVQNMMLQLLSGLDSKDYDIFVISKPDGPLVREIKNREYKYIPLPYLRRNISIFYDVISFFSLLAIMRKQHFDIVHTHSSKTGFLGRIAARFAGVKKIVHTSHGFPFHQFQSPFIRNFYIFLERFATLFCDKVIFVNKEDYRDAIKLKIVPPSKALVIYNGISLPVSQKIFNCLVWEKQIVVGSISRFSEQKNILQVISTAIKVCRLNQKLRFIFVGNGDFYEQAKKMTINSGFKNRILLPGWQKNVNEWLLKFDIFLLYSKWEGLPISILEAMSVGLPVIASDIKGNRELVDKNNGYLININSPEDLENILLNLPDKCNEFKRKGANSRKIAQNNFSLTDFINSYRELYAQ